MKKIVNVVTRTPIPTASLPIRGVCNGLNLETEDILKCICGRATVVEVLEDGTKLPLNLSNYNKDNNALIKEALELEALEAAEKVKADAIQAEAERKAAAVAKAATEREEREAASKKIADEKAAAKTADSSKQTNSTPATTDKK